jgi:hypothetical protein
MNRLIHFAALALAASAPSFAQDSYPDSDPRSTQYGEYLRREQEQQAEKDKAAKARAEEDSARIAGITAPDTGSQGQLQDVISGAVEQDRAMFLKTPPLPVARNVLLGQWKLDKTKTATTNPLAELNAMFSQPACEMVFGDGIWDFRPQALWSDDEGIGVQMLTEVSYRGNEGTIGVVPKTFMRLLIFKVVSRNRVQELTSTRIGADPCTFVRVGSTAQAARPATSTSPVAATARQAVAPVASDAAAAPRSTLSRPSPEVCRQTLLDKLGVVGVNQVRAMSDVRFKEPAVEGKDPKTGRFRIYLFASACDDPRIKSTWYDFDAEGILQAITYMWDRPPGPAPAAIFQERVNALSIFHKLPPPQAPGKLQADTSLGTLNLQDIPERKTVLEEYSRKN